MPSGVQDLPKTAPVMVLGGATLFPCGYMPLFIFEPRYRAMLSYALENDRLFCVGHARPGIDTDLSSDPVFPITTIGLIRACVTHDDGTSHLMLSGLQRVEITGWTQDCPFRIASIRPRPCHVSDPEAATEAALQLVDLSSKLCGKGQPVSEQLRNHLHCVKDPCAIADVVAQSFVSDPGERQRLLEIDDLVIRLDDLVGHLSSLLADGK
ncbi:MAG: LON peptidase substrate-binding domain-containing protein [Verrucomicrobiae bacterium]|nr:LON peptidase substrate-binding domain-containing protein [Verrucomicrobiae bacterium]